MTDKLRIEYTTDEREDTLAAVFEVGGNTIIIHIDGCTITIPSHVWDVALPWIEKRQALAEQLNEHKET